MADSFLTFINKAALELSKPLHAKSSRLHIYDKLSVDGMIDQGDRSISYYEHIYGHDRTVVMLNAKAREASGSKQFDAQPRTCAHDSPVSQALEFGCQPVSDLVDLTGDDDLVLCESDDDELPAPALGCQPGSVIPVGNPRVVVQKILPWGFWKKYCVESSTPAMGCFMESRIGFSHSQVHVWFD